MPHYTAMVTLLAVALYFYTGLLVAKARQKFGISAPATTGNADFERVFRVQMNTLEWMPILLPALWLFAVYVNDWAAALLGLVWIVGRIVYIRGYAEAAAKLQEKIRAEAERYRDEQKDLEAKARELEQEFGLAHRKTDRFDLGEVFLEIALVITSITLLSGRRIFWHLGLLFGAAGIVIAASACIVH